MGVSKISKRVVDSVVPTGRDTFLWDSELSGFGLKVTASGRKIYICQYRRGGGRSGKVRRFTIGPHGAPWTAEQARAEAKRLLSLVVSGRDPADERFAERDAITVSELCDLYLSEGCATKKPATLVTDRSRINRHIKPLIGSKKVRDLDHGDIQRFLQDIAAGKSKLDVKTKSRGRAIVKGGRGAATRTLGLLGGILTFAIARKLREDNPVHGVERFPDRKNERFLSLDELTKVGTALSELDDEGTNQAALKALRLLTLTGARKSEITTLKWKEVDIEARCLRLDDSKTGQKVIVLGDAAIELLQKLRQDDSSDYVFPSRDGLSGFKGIEKIWAKVREKLEDPALRIHDLRHSFASVGINNGSSLPMIGALLGHADVKTTARYAHLSNHPVQLEATRISGAIAAALAAKGASAANEGAPDHPDLTLQGGDASPRGG